MPSLLERLFPGGQDVIVAVIASVVMLLWIIGAVRIAGLRSFSKMSSFDFATTVAIGSTLATVSLTGQPLGTGLIVVATLLGVQVLVSRGRLLAGLRFLENQPLLLMHDGEFIDDNLRRSRVTRDDVLAKIRAANAGDLSQVRAVVLETTGDVSVLHGEQDVDPRVLSDVEFPDGTLASRGQR